MVDETVYLDQQVVVFDRSGRLVEVAKWPCLRARLGSNQDVLYDGSIQFVKGRCVIMVRLSLLLAACSKFFIETTPKKVSDEILRRHTLHVDNPTIPL